jgi:hypothetical protein
MAGEAEGGTEHRLRLFVLTTYYLIIIMIVIILTNITHLILGCRI